MFYIVAGGALCLLSVWHGIAATLSCISWVLVVLEERDEMMLAFSMFIHNAVLEGRALESALFSLSSLRFLNVSVKALWGPVWVFLSWLWDKLVIIWIYKVFIDDRVLLISGWHFWPNASAGLSFLSTISATLVLNVLHSMVPAVPVHFLLFLFPWLRGHLILSA